MRSRRAPRWYALLAASFLAAPAHALEPIRIGGDAVQLDVTNASSLLLNFDNRDFKQHDVTTLANDAWGVWYNRLNLQANYHEWTAGVRVDNAWFYTSPDPTAIGLELVERRPVTAGALPAPTYFRSKVQEAGAELSNRYINWVYPAKYYVGYTTRNVEATVGDFYSQLGRGLVLSVRKLDELSSDTTVRGARVTGRLNFGDLRTRLTALGGSMNPLRLDESSGRYLGVSSDVTQDWLAVTEAGMPRAVETDFVPDTGDCTSFGTCTYAPDKLIAGQLELGTDDVKFGTQASLLMRQEPLSIDVVRSAQEIFTGSQSVDVPDLGGHGAAYVEAAWQRFDHEGSDSAATSGTAPSLDPGHALYAAVTLIEMPVSLLLEGKHYRRFFPLSSNVKLTRAREYNLVQYSAPPTTEAFWVDTAFEGFNTCVSGGRAKGDLEVGDDESVFAWVGRYHTWAESVTNAECEISDANLNRVWDVATGFEATSQRRKSRASVTFGARIDETDRELDDVGGTTNVFYQESYGRYDIIRSLGGPYALQFQGWHRRRRQTLGGPGEPWLEGFHLTGFSIAPHLSLAFGVEYDSRPTAATTYFNGQAAWKFTSDTSVSLFVGQRRGALRCVGGVCRVFPPFEGARLDFTARY